MPPTGRARHAVIRRATTGRSPTGRHPSGHATRVGRIGCPLCAAFPLGVGKPPNDSALAAPLGHMNRAQLKKPRQRGQLHAVVRRAGKAPGRTRRGTRGHGTRGYAPPWSGLTGHGTRGHAPPWFRTRPAQDSRARQRAGHHGPSSQRARRAALPRAVIRRATTGRSPTGRHPSGHATRVGSIRRPPSVASPLGVGKPPNVAVSGAAGHMNRAQPHEPRQRCPLHRLVRRPGA